MFQKQNNKKFIRVNYLIKSPTVRVVQDGKQLGVFPIETARKMAFDANLDLVEVAPLAKPPVCSILNFDKYRYELKQKEKEAKKKQKTTEIKEIRFRPCTQDHDLETKVSSIKKFIAEGKKVNLVVRYSRRELLHKEEGFAIINTTLDKLQDSVIVEMRAKFEGSRLVCRVAPNKEQND